MRYRLASSPDFKPIEVVFAKLKTHRRGVAARAFAPLVAAMGTGLEQITTADIASDYRHRGVFLPEDSEQLHANRA